MKRPEFKPRDTGTARALRNAPSPAEQMLWRHLSRSQLGGHKFSRQIPIGPYFADFVCRTSKLVIELDGYSHDTVQDSDARRTAFMNAEGFTVIRFANEEVLGNTEGVIMEIEKQLACRPTPSPSRKREGSQ